jgi:hypothetical protein
MVPEGLNHVEAIAAGDNHIVALKQDGTVAAWGLNFAGQISVPVGLYGVLAVAAGGDRTAVLKATPPLLGGPTTVANRSALKLSMTAGRRYQLMSSQDLKSWRTVGTTFTADSSVLSQDVEATDRSRYFQLIEAP